MIPKNDFIDCSKVFKLKVGEGENSKTFFIHPDLLAKRSKSFVMDCWEKGLDEMVMPDSDPQVVANYMHIVQSGTSPFSWFPWSECSESENKHAAHEILKHLCEIYVFAEGVQDEHMKDFIMKRIIELQYLYQVTYRALFPSKEVVDIIYKGTLEDDKARKYFVDVFVHYSEGQGYYSLKNTCGEDYHPGFLLELAQALVKVRPQSTANALLDPNDYLIKTRNSATQEVEAKVTSLMIQDS